MNEQPETNENYQIDVHLDPESPTGVYIPKDLEEMIAEFNKILSVAWKLKLLEDSIYNHHFTLGMWLKNNWNLWNYPPLVQTLFEEGATPHVDDLSILLLQIYRRYLENPFYHLKNVESLGEVHNGILNHLKALLNCDRATLWIIDNSRQEAVTNLYIGNQSKELRIPQNAGWVGLAMQCRQTINIPFDLYDYPDRQELIEQSKLIDFRTRYRSCSLLVMPICNSDGKINSILISLNKIKLGQFPYYNGENFPQPPECWQNSFTNFDEMLLEKLNEHIAALVNRLSV